VVAQDQASATDQAVGWLEIARALVAPARVAGRALAVGQAADRWPAAADVHRSAIYKTS
jgi:hypothetical protein